ncbi:MAG TPA: DsrE family protein [Usitatibacteraceae bacterium]|nr:DsrE family protein [Usitatibacteraceae bacterium]
MIHALARRSFAASLLLAGFLAFPSSAMAADAAGRYRLVIQVSDNDPAKWNLALNNARNVQVDLGMDNVDVEIVAYGPGLPMLKADSKVAQRLDSAIKQGVGLMACENTMKNTKVERSEIQPGVKFVDAGVVHLMKRQREGWSYVRP